MTGTEHRSRTAMAVPRLDRRRLFWYSKSRKGRQLCPTFQQGCVLYLSRFFSGKRA